MNPTCLFGETPYYVSGHTHPSWQKTRNPRIAGNLRRLGCLNFGTGLSAPYARSLRSITTSRTHRMSPRGYFSLRLMTTHGGYQSRSLASISAHLSFLRTLPRRLKCTMYASMPPPVHWRRQCWLVTWSQQLTGARRLPSSSTTSCRQSHCRCQWLCQCRVLGTSTDFSPSGLIFLAMPGAGATSAPTRVALASR